MSKPFNLIEYPPFGRLTVIEMVGRSTSGRIRWRCVCTCGNETICTSSDLLSGDSRSCGCLKAEKARERATVHGHSRVGKKTKTYRAWRNMIGRCHYPSSTNWNHYGGRGIKICSRFKVFAEFLLDMGDAPPTKTLDRKDNDGNYSCGKCIECVMRGWPANCRWATVREQNRNQQDNHLITFNGETRCLMEWAEIAGLQYFTLFVRIYRYGWSIEKALVTPARKHRQYRRRKRPSPQEQPPSPAPPSAAEPPPH